MSRAEALLGRLEAASDWLSPIVVKEVRQLARGREFIYSFGASLVAGLAVAFFGAADALSGTGTAGRWTFSALMACLTLLGLVVVPLGAFSALRLERMQQTFELVSLTALSPRRVVIGKLLAQGVKLTTLFAGMAPFITMSFLLGGIDFATILVSLAILFMWSLWTSAAALFFSSLLKSRAMAGLVFGGAAIVLFLMFGVGRMLYFLVSRGGLAVGGVGIGPMGPRPWWMLAIMTTFCVASMVNLVLLAENRLSLPTENRVTPLRVGFLVQFLLIVAWTLTYIDEPLRARSNAIEVLGVLGGLHLAVVALFTVTEDLALPRRVWSRMTAPSRWRWLFTMFLPGGGRGAIYVLAQMAILCATVALFQPDGSQISWSLAMCGYICVFTGLPTFAFRSLLPGVMSSVHLRVAALVLFALSMVLPDLIYYVLWQPDVLDLGYSRRHLINPIRTLANWSRVYSPYLVSLPVGFGLAGVLAYLALIRLGSNVTAQPALETLDRSPAKAGDPDRASALY